MACVNHFGEYSNMIVLSMPDHMKGNNGGFILQKIPFLSILVLSMK